MPKAEEGVTIHDVKIDNFNFLIKNKNSHDT
jgi:hypothetical protein